MTPSLNQGQFLRRNIHSVRRQSYERIEHLIVDGESSDGTLDILRQHADSPRLRWISEPDGGLYDAVNKGLRSNAGEIQGYLNVDDAYFPWTVEVVVDAFCRNPGAGLVFGDAVYIHEDNQRGVPRFSPPFNLGMVRRTTLLCQPAVFWRREVFEALGGFDENLQLAGDCDFWMRAGGRFDVKKVDEILAIDAVRPTALRYARAAELRREVESVRGRYGPRTGFRFRAYLLFDSLRHLARAQWRFTAFTCKAVASGFVQPDRLPLGWSHFLAGDETVRLSLGRLLLGNLPLRNRPLGIGSVTRTPEHRYHRPVSAARVDETP